MSAADEPVVLSDKELNSAEALGAAWTTERVFAELVRGYRVMLAQRERDEAVGKLVEAAKALARDVEHPPDCTPERCSWPLLHELRAAIAHPALAEVKR